MLLNVRLMGFYFFFMRHNSSLVCMVGVTYVYIDTIFACHGYIFLILFIYFTSDSKLKKTDDKIELIAIGTKSKTIQVTPNHTSASISGGYILCSQSSRNLDFVLEETLCMDIQIRYLRRILFCVSCADKAKFPPILSTDAANKLATLTRLDYCSSHLTGLPDNILNKLQRMENHAARIVLCNHRHVSAASLLRTLH